MPELLRSKRVKARKAHKCATCWCMAIQPGQEYQRETYAYDGTVYDWVQCSDCSAMSALVFAWTLYADEGIGFSEYSEWAQEHLDHPEHGEIARLYLNRVHGALVELTNATTQEVPRD